MRQVRCRPEPVPLGRVEMPFGTHPVGLQRRQHRTGLLRYHHRIQFALEENHRHLDLRGMQQWRARLITLHILLRVADQPVQVIAFELVRGARQRQRVADPVQARPATEHILERQRTQRGVAPGAAPADERLRRVDQPLPCQEVDHRAGILHVHFAPAQVQGLAIGAAIAAAATVVEVGHGKAALGPVLDARVEHREARRGRSAMHEHHQRRRLDTIHGRVEEGVRLGIAAGVGDAARLADLFAGQGHRTAGQHLNGMAVAVDGDDGGRADGRGGDGIQVPVVDLQAAKAGVDVTEVFQGAIGMMHAQAAEAALEPARQIPAAVQGQPGAGAQLPRCAGMVGALGRQCCPALRGFAPGLPVAVTIRQAVQATVGIEARLLQRFRLRLAAGDAARRFPGVCIAAFGAQQAGGSPGLVRAAPFDPGQALAVGAEGGSGIEVGAFGQYRAGAGGDRYQPVHIGVFFNRQHLAGAPAQVTVAALAVGQRLRLPAAEPLAVELLVGFVDEHQPVVAQAETAAAILVDAAAHAEAVGGQAAGLAVTPLPDAATAVLGAKLVPEQPQRAALEFGVVGAGGNRLLCAETLSRGR